MTTLTAPRATPLPQLPITVPKVDHIHHCPDCGSIVGCFVGETCEWEGDCGGGCTDSDGGAALSEEIRREATRYTY